MKTYTHQHIQYDKSYVKYQGTSSRIDVKDSIINILARHPGLEHEQIFLLIYPAHFYKSKNMVLDVLTQMVSEQYLIENSGEYFIWDDAWSHDVAKTKDTIDKLLTLGVTPQMAAFLSEGLIIAREEASQNKYEHIESIEEVAVPDVLSQIGIIEFNRIKSETLKTIELEESKRALVDEIENFNKENNKSTEVVVAKRSLLKRFMDLFK